MPPIVPTIAVIELSFDPIARIGDWNVRLETIALALVFLAGLLVAARIAGQTPVDVSRPPDAPGPESGESNHLRRDDLLYVVVAALPGAVVGGRLGYALLHLDYYVASPGAILDVSQGGLQLSLAVVGGTLTACVVAGLLGAPVGRWLHAVVLPLLFVLAAGKAALVLGGDGQGVPTEVAWATAYTGPGPWGSLAPDVPSHPAQAYEALATALVLLAMVGLLAAGAFRRRDVTAFLLGVALWAGARAVVAATWRDPLVAGPLRMDQVLSIAIAAAALLALAALMLRSRGRAGPAGGRDAAGAGVSLHGDTPDWPDPAARPRF